MPQTGAKVVSAFLIYCLVSMDRAALLEETVLLELVARTIRLPPATPVLSLMVVAVAVALRVPTGSKRAATVAPAGVHLVLAVAVAERLTEVVQAVRTLVIEAATADRGIGAVAVAVQSRIVRRDIPNTVAPAVLAAAPTAERSATRGLMATDTL
jgi:hypothetical protein